MSFLSGILGNSADKYVDQAVDTAAKAAKVKVKTMLDSKKKESSGGTSGKEKVKPMVGGDDSKKESNGGSSGGIGGIGGIGGLDGNKGKEGGGIGSLVSGKDKTESSSGGGDKDLTDLLGDIAGDMSGEKDNK
ncbi:co-chaperone protein p23-1 [Coregonus clupeaformis]|uniref:co-chaperone protein p23-1 n=1 Tax=Coregonus clupeaformis TaxID=59861 RepID=UPI001BE054D5|nr:co-chaperone protein p23-1 [Coregonus clupeaformis]